ncbi:MAG: hypothetical protein JWN84_2579 [Nocardioides sp.]|nr:hypothetical protein [Nocardioides sp.]
MTSALSRRHFLLSTGVGAGALVAAGPAGALAPPVVRVDTHPVFDRAARAHGVPPALLAALGYAQTRWADHDGRPSASLGHGPMHLVDGAAAAEARARSGKADARAVIDTLHEAATAAGLDPDVVRRDADANVLATAALLAARQRAARRPVGVGTDPAQWFGTVATSSGLVTATTQLELAETVMTTVRDGGRVELADGSVLELAPSRVGTADRQRTALRSRAAEARRQAARSNDVEAPPGLDVEWIPAPYEQYGPGPGDYGNHDLGDRPRAPGITHLLIHDTECSYDLALDLVTDPTYVSWQYTLRSSDGHIAQHVKARDVAWHAGNWYLNMHSIGLEHEGYAAQGAPWYSDAMYRTSARLTRHLARQHGVPLDRAHVIGHDQVPGATSANIRGMHWDPGPFWDWERYFDLMGASLRQGTVDRPAVHGDVVRILPGFAGNVQPLTGCEAPGDDCRAPRDTNFVILRTEPRADAPLVNDRGIDATGGPGTTMVSDISARATAGTEYVVAEVQGDWTAVWFLGALGWFANPASRPTARVVKRPLGKVRAKGSPAATYGRCYPEASAYSNPADVQPVSPLVYALAPGQEYAVGDLDPVTDFYKAKTYSIDTPGDHVDILGQDRYVQINLGHRIAFVRRDEVEIVR